MRRDPEHRTSRPRLNDLAADYMFLEIGRPRRAVLGEISLGNIGLHVTRYLADRFGADREMGIETCADEAARLLGLRSLRSLNPGERVAWTRWAPLVMALPGVGRWPAADRHALRDVVRAKGGQRESDFVRRFDRHRRLRQAVAALANEEVEG